jgi:hypothetical protein
VSPALAAELVCRTTFDCRNKPLTSRLNQEALALHPASMPGTAAAKVFAFAAKPAENSELHKQKLGWLFEWAPLKKYATQEGFPSVPSDVIHFLIPAMDPAIRGPLIDKAALLSTSEQNAIDLSWLDDYLIPSLPVYRAFVESLLMEFVHSKAPLIFVGRASDILFEMAQALAFYDSRFYSFRGRLHLMDYSPKKFRQSFERVQVFLVEQFSKMRIDTYQIVLVDACKLEGDTMRNLSELFEYILWDMNVMEESPPVIETRVMSDEAAFKDVAWGTGNTYFSGRRYRVKTRRGKLVQIYDSLEKFTSTSLYFASNVVAWSADRGPLFYAARRLLQKGIIATWVEGDLQRTRNAKVVQAAG